MAISNTGLANPQDYLLGRGVVQIAKLDADGNPGPFRDVGNAPSFSISAANQTVEHQSSRHGTAFIDKRITTSQALSCAFEIDEVQNFNNLADWLVGEADTVPNLAIAGFGEWQPIGDSTDGVELASWLGRHMLIKDDPSTADPTTDGLRAYNVDTGDLTLATTESTPVTLADGTDYILDVENGSVFFGPDSTVLATAIAAGKGVKMTLDADSDNTVEIVDRARAFKSTALNVAVRFILENAADNANQSELILPNCNLNSDGDLSLIGKDFASMKFGGSVEPGKIGSLYEGEFVVIVDGGKEQAAP